MKRLARYTLPAVDCWEVSGDNQQLITVSSRSDKKNGVIANVRVSKPGVPRSERVIATLSHSVRRCVWSPSQTRLALIGNEGLTLLTRQSQPSGKWKQSFLPASAEEACFLSDDRLLVATLESHQQKKGFSLLALPELKVLKTLDAEISEYYQRHYQRNKTLDAFNVLDLTGPELHFNGNTPFVRVDGSGVMLIPTGIVVRADGTLQSNRPIGTDSLYDLAAGPLKGGWMLTIYQQTSPKGETLVFTVDKTHLLLQSLSNEKNEPLAWIDKERISKAQIVGNDLWCELSDDWSESRTTLRRYRITL